MNSPLIDSRAQPALQASPMASCPNHVKVFLDMLGISIDIVAARSLPLHLEASDLVIAETDAKGKEYLLTPPAAAWCTMKAAAVASGIKLRIFSAFRSIERQAEIIRAKFEKGISLEDILRVNAPPGYSEHHTGRAIDITTDGMRSLAQDFEHSAAFQWLDENAPRFGYSLSFPRNNRYGFIYEPWHWCFTDSDSKE
jgi:zinc D-Ala-D-Ala carboxypeptidase